LIERWAIRSDPSQAELLPSTTTSLHSTSTPEEMLARGDWMEKSLNSDSSSKSPGAISFSARATPNAPAARANAIERLGSLVRGVFPAAIAAAARPAVTQGHLT